MENTVNSHPTPRKGFPWLVALLVLVLGAGMGVLFLGYIAHTATKGLWDQLASVVTGRTHTEFHSQPAIVQKIQQLQRLETVAYTTDKIVEGDRAEPHPA